MSAKCAICQTELITTTKAPSVSLFIEKMIVNTIPCKADHHIWIESEVKEHAA